MPASKPHDYTTHGMTQGEMKKRIKSHYAMAAKSFQKYENTKIPSDFLSKEYQMWSKDNQTSPWFNKGGGYDQMEKRASVSYASKQRAEKRLTTGKKLVNKLHYDKANNLKSKFGKLKKRITMPINKKSKKY